MKTGFVVILGLMWLLTFSVNVQSQDQVTLGDKDGPFWTLPATECSGDNFCEIRISPEGTIYSWDMVNLMLYISRKNEVVYEIYNLGQYSQNLIYAIDFIPFDPLGYVVFFSPIGASRALTRYDINTLTLNRIRFPSESDLIGCNITTGVRQLRLRQVFQLSSNHVVACTASSELKPLIQILDIETLVIDETLDIDGGYANVFQPGWILSAGSNGKIYAVVHNPGSVIGDLPEINETTEEFVIVYDIESRTWTYQIKPLENTFEILAIFLDDTVLFQNYTLTGGEIIQFTPDFQILRRFGLNAGVFLGVSSEGEIFFSISSDYGDISIFNIEDFPVVFLLPASGIDHTLTANTSGFSMTTLNGSASNDSNGDIIYSYIDTNWGWQNVP